VPLHSLTHLTASSGIHGAPEVAHLATQVLLRRFDRHDSGAQRIALQQGLHAIGQGAQARRRRSPAAACSPFREQVASQVDRRHHREVAAVDGTCSITEPTHRLVYELRYALQLTRMDVASDPILLAEHSDGHRTLASHELGAARREAPFDLVDLPDEIVDALGDVAP